MQDTPSPSSSLRTPVRADVALAHLFSWQCASGVPAQRGQSPAAHDCAGPGKPKCSADECQDAAHDCGQRPRHSFAQPIPNTQPTSSPSNQRQAADGLRGSEQAASQPQTANVNVATHAPPKPPHASEQQEEHAGPHGPPARHQRKERASSQAQDRPAEGHFSVQHVCAQEAQTTIAAEANWSRPLASLNGALFFLAWSSSIQVSRSIMLPGMPPRVGRQTPIPACLLSHRPVACHLCRVCSCSACSGHRTHACCIVSAAHLTC